MRFKLDENLDPRFAAPIVSAGHDVASVLSQNLSGRSDEVNRAERDSLREARPEGQRRRALAITP